MPDLISELNEQPGALRSLARYYSSREGTERLAAGAPSRLVIFTGMGASYHAALIAAAQAGALGLPSLAVEAIDLLNYIAAGLLQSGHTLVYISQSGKSVEVEAILRENASRAAVIAVTNQPASLLGQSAAVCLPILADQHFRMASKNYINSLAALWLLVRRWAGTGGPGDVEILNEVAGRVEAILARREETCAALLEAFQPASPLVLLGHGPHSATARQSALMLSEWARTPALHVGIGAFRHGFVETVTPQMGALFFIPPGRTAGSALALARTLPEFGVTVRRLSFGQLCDLDEGENSPGEFSQSEEALDEFLSPILDVIPMQLFTAALSERKGVTPDFRYLDRTRML